MSSFTKPLKLKKIDDGLYRTTRAFAYYIKDPNKNIILVPKDYTTDCASIPWPFNLSFKKDDPKWAQAAVLHDWLYEHSGFVGWDNLTRKKCDIIFRESMKVLGASFFTRWSFYYALRSFGWIGYIDWWKEGMKVRLLIGDKDLVGKKAIIKKKYFWSKRNKNLIIEFDNNKTIITSILNLEATF